MTEPQSPSRDQTPLRSSRRCFRFSLRTMLIAVTAIGLLLGLWIVPSERQRRFCEQLKSEGSLFRIHTANTSKEMLVRFKRQPKWYDHYFYSLQEVILTTNDKKRFDELAQFPSLKMLMLNGPIENSQIERLSQLHLLESMVINTGVSENKKELISIAALQNLFKLKTLGLLGPTIRSSDLEHVSHMKSLETFYGEFESETISSDDLHNFGKLPLLDTLHLWNMSIAEDRYEFIALCKNLEELELKNSSFGDRSVKFLAACQKLQSLHLSSVKLTDQGFADMPALPALEEIYLPNVSVTVQGLRRLKKFPKLKELYLRNTSFEESDKEELQNALPNVTIEY